ncbi:MAG: lamin tail domain-containing protein, partial [Patescibacteria group bacterium]|nr:lamin tail domain-containing protein [Patescibacteria group bacterium]
MRRFFVLCICFCLLFSQNAFSVTKNISNDIISKNDLGVDKKEDEITDLNVDELATKIEEIEAEKTETDSELQNETSTTETHETVEVQEKLPETTPETDIPKNNPEIEQPVKQKGINTKSRDTTCLPVDKVNRAATESTQTKPSSKEEAGKQQGIASNIRINEILANPDGTDSGNEFIEFYNDGDIDISLENWCLHDKTNKCYNFGDITIESKD